MITSPKNNKKIYDENLVTLQNNISILSTSLVCNPGTIKTSLHAGAKEAT
jgi:hypothetical protein